MVLFGHKWFYLGKTDNISAKLLCSDKSGSIRNSILEKIVLIGQNWLYSGKMVVIGQKWFSSGKSGCSRAKWLLSGKVVAFSQNWF